MRSHPSRLFITSLLFRGKSNTEIDDILAEYGLPAIPESFKFDYLDSLKEGLNKKTIKNHQPLITRLQ